MNKPSKCSWMLRKILDFRELASLHISYVVGDDNRNSLWFNPGVDTIQWDGIRLKSLRVTDLWQSIRMRGHVTPWYNSVWHKLGVPRFACHHWLIMHGRVRTLSHLKQIGIVNDVSCYFCINGEETIPHLFLECPFTQHLFNLITSGKGLSLPTGWASWHSELVNHNAKNIVHALRSLVFQVGAYYMWNERNNRFHTGDSLSPRSMAEICTNVISSRLETSTWFTKEKTKHDNLSIWCNQY